MLLLIPAYTPCLSQNVVAGSTWVLRLFGELSLYISFWGNTMSTFSSLMCRIVLWEFDLLLLLLLLSRFRNLRDHFMNSLCGKKVKIKSRLRYSKNNSTQKNILYTYCYPKHTTMQPLFQKDVKQKNVTVCLQVNFTQPIIF